MYTCIYIYMHAHIRTYNAIQCFAIYKTLCTQLCMWPLKEDRCYYPDLTDEKLEAWRASWSDSSLSRSHGRPRWVSQHRWGTCTTRRCTSQNTPAGTLHLLWKNTQKSPSHLSNGKKQFEKHGSEKCYLVII